MSNVVRLEYAYGVCPKCKRANYLRYLIHHDGLIHKPYEIKCLNCNSYFAKEDILGSGEETAPKPITNADRIRGMTDEELAKWVNFHTDCENCPNRGCADPYSNPTFCVNSLLSWLKSPVEVDNG